MVWERCWVESASTPPPVSLSPSSPSPPPHRAHDHDAAPVDDVSAVAPDRDVRGAGERGGRNRLCGAADVETSPRQQRKATLVGATKVPEMKQLAGKVEGGVGRRGAGGSLERATGGRRVRRRPRPPFLCLPRQDAQTVRGHVEVVAVKVGHVQEPGIERYAERAVERRAPATVGGARADGATAHFARIDHVVCQRRHNEVSVRCEEHEIRPRRVP